MYDLAVQKLVKTLQPGIKWISAIDMHPSGDHLLVSGYDRKLCWFDLELSEKPYKVLRYEFLLPKLTLPHPLEDIIPGRSELLTSTHHTQFLRLVLMMGPFKSFMQGYTMT